MLVYRITRKVYAYDLTGTGARTYGGRWNSIGKAMLYTASSRSLAVLETVVHLPPAVIPDDYCIVTIDAPDDIFEADTSLFPPNWNAHTEPEILKRIGDFFLKENKYLLMKVPSAIIKAEFNYLLNSAHAKINRVKILEIEPFTFDERLLV